MRHNLIVIFDNFKSSAPFPHSHHYYYPKCAQRCCQGKAHSGFAVELPLFHKENTSAWTPARSSNISLAQPTNQLLRMISGLEGLLLFLHCILIRSFTENPTEGRDFPLYTPLLRDDKVLTAEFLGK